MDENLALAKILSQSDAFRPRSDLIIFLRFSSKDTGYKLNIISL